MKILLDECVTKKLRQFLTDKHSVFTVSQMNWTGFRNGNLLGKAIENNFDIVITIDKNMLYQLNISNYEIIIVVFDSPSSKIELLKNFIPQFEMKINEYRKGNVYVLKSEV